ncbi:MAG: ROK family protein [Oscillatoriales cyanobacterium RM1_1_9]|nr:ROK family protein [Oscillatoriales cyanobacterium SM2_3_0]NJO45948.1 ROK family protein [Oscillatoriales cyanobacterium RM2_1_1]NJO70898.1 ROK family protein [Oscillatoriales cyanobacterium RM1_1_9]
MNSQVIGIDIGGSAIKLGRYDLQGKCHQLLSVSTPQPATPLKVFGVLVDAIAQILPGYSSPGLGVTQGEVRAIGIGLPGPVDSTGRTARVAINLQDWKDVPLAEWVEAKIGLPVIMANDANCAGLGEAWLGAGQGIQNLVVITLGTGVGGAVILEGKLFVGHRGSAGELGLITLNPDGPLCNSGNQGSLEQYVSVQAIRRLTGLDPAELAARAYGGEIAALEFWQQYGRWLGAGLASLIYVLTPEAIILGGGISAGAELFLPETKAEIERRVLPSSREGIQLLIAELGNQAGAVGAARLALQTFSSLEL